MEPESISAVGTTLDMDLKTPEPANKTVCVDSKLRLIAASGTRLHLRSNGLTAHAQLCCPLGSQRFNQTGAFG
jgi:hypothetical protein